MMAVAFVLQPCECQTLVFLVRNKSDTLKRNWRELQFWRAVGREFHHGVVLQL